VGTKGGGWTTRFARPYPPLAIDREGRIYGHGRFDVWRFKPGIGVEAITGPGGLAFQGQGVDDGTSGYAHHPVIGPDDVLYFIDGRTRQIKRVATKELP
jgi:hypothetical protein